jgi:hypothetical protein
MAVSAATLEYFYSIGGNCFRLALLSMKPNAQPGSGLIVLPSQTRY